MSNEITDTGLQVNPNAIAKYIGLDPRDERSHAVVAVCERYGLDPVLKHIIVLPKGGAYITRDGYLHIAHKSGQLDGIVLEEQGTDDGEHWAIVAVYRKDMSHPFRYRGRYSMTGHNKQYGPEMAVKNAEVQALRRAFDVAGLPAADEQQPRPATVSTAHLAPPTPDTTDDVVDFDTGEIVDAEVMDIPEGEQ